MDRKKCIVLHDKYDVLPFFFIIFFLFWTWCPIFLFASDFSRVYESHVHSVSHLVVKSLILELKMPFHCDLGTTDVESTQQQSNSLHHMPFHWSFLSKSVNYSNFHFFPLYLRKNPKLQNFLFKTFNFEINYIRVVLIFV